MKWTQEQRLIAIRTMIPIMFPHSVQAEWEILAETVELQTRDGRACYVETVPLAIELACQRNELLEALNDLVNASWMVSVDWAPTSMYEAICNKARAAIAKSV